MVRELGLGGKNVCVCTRHTTAPGGGWQRLRLRGGSSQRQALEADRTSENCRARIEKHREIYI